MIQPEKLGVRHPMCMLVRSKAGVALYHITSEGKKLILKIFENQEDTREIENYLILSKLGIPTIQKMQSCYLIYKLVSNIV